MNVVLNEELHSVACISEHQLVTTHVTGLSCALVLLTSGLQAVREDLCDKQPGIFSL